MRRGPVKKALENRKRIDIVRKISSSLLVRPREGEKSKKKPNKITRPKPINTNAEESRDDRGGERKRQVLSQKKILKGRRVESCGRGREG